jgi:hypothetical protein
MNFEAKLNREKRGGGNLGYKDRKGGKWPDFGINGRVQG